MTGVPFLTNVASGYRLYVEVAWGADLTVDPMFWSWFDVTTDVLIADNGGIAITVGRANEAQVAQPATCTLRFKNPTGTYTPTNPASAHYPYVRLGTPIRVSVSIDGGLTVLPRFQGEAAAWQPGWDAQGRKAYVTLVASGVTRRLGSGSKPLRSPLTRSIVGTTTATLNQYWPCEDGRDATIVASGLPSGVPMSLNADALPGSFDMSAAELTFAKGVHYGTDLLPQLNNGGQLVASFPNTGSTTSWTVQVTTYVDVFDTVALVPAFEVQSSGSFSFQWITDSNPAAIGVNATRVMAVDSSGSATQVCALTGISVLSEARIDLAQSGGNISVTMTAINTQGESFTASGSIAGTLGAATGWVGNPTGMTLTTDFALGHVRIWDGNSAPDFQTSTTATSAWVSYNGELASDRLSRLCAEEGIVISVTGSSDTAMGPQGIDTFLNLLRECETSDIGVLLDGLGPGLTYICRSSLTNRAVDLTIDANSGQVPATPGPQPTFDDQRIVNRVTVTNVNGSTVVVEDTDGPLGTVAVGVRDGRTVVNLASDASLPNIGAFLIQISTPATMRYPQMLLDLTAAPELASDWLTCIPTSRLNVENLSNRLTQLPTPDFALAIDGWAETLNSKIWRVQFNLSDYEPWDFASLNGLFRLEMAGQTLAASLVHGATSLSLATASGHALFTTTAKYPADFPLILNVAGWPIAVTAASGTSSPQTLTITAAPNTSTIPSGTAVTLWQPTGVLAL